MDQKNSQSTINKVLGDYPGRTLHRIGTALGGIWLTSTIINFLWPLPDQVLSRESSIQREVRSVPIPKKNINILLFGVNSLTSDLPNHKDQINERNYLEKLAVIRISNNQVIRFIEIPTKLKIILPGSKKLYTLSESYQTGGISLGTDIATKLLRLPKKEPQRYISLTPKILSQLVDDIGGISVSLNASLRLDEPAEKNSTLLSPAVQTLNGLQVRKVMLYKENDHNKRAIRSIKKSIIIGLWKELKSPENASNILTLSEGLINTTKTNISEQELLSLFAAIIAGEKAPIIEEIDLYPYAGD